MSTINMADLERVIKACYKANEPLLALGPPGMGKTAMWERVCKDLEIGFIDFRLSLRDPVDVGGMRIPDLKTGILKHYVPEDLPNEKRHGKRGIVLFDEINAVGPLMQATAYGIIQERRNGNYRMPEGWVPMGAGNHTTHGAAAQRITTALANRFNVQRVEPDFQSWLDQYASENVDHRGCAFIRFRPALFHVMPLADQISFPSARSWTKSFKFIDEPESFRRKMYSGYVGDAAADEFESFWRILEKAVTVEQIIKDPKGTPVPEDTDAGTYFAVSGMLARSIDRKNVEPIMTYVSRMLPDYQVAVVQDFTKREPGLKNTAAYGNWAVAHQDVTL